MPRAINDLRVFIASPSGLKDVRIAFRDAIDRFNKLDPRNRKVIFTAVGWEDTLPGYGRPQARINEDLRTCDYFVLVLWDRWGSSPDTTGKYSSGSEEEFQEAVKSLEAGGPIRQVVICFREVDKRQLDDPGEQLQAVLTFRRNLEKSKKHFFRTFSQLQDFDYELTRQLHSWARDHHGCLSEHHEIIKQGVDAWNTWRSLHPEVKPVLAGVDLSGQYLSEIDLSEADLSGAKLDRATLVGANLSSAKLADASLVGTNLFHANLCRSILTGAVLAYTHLEGANLDAAVFDRTTCADIDLGSALNLEKVLHKGRSEIGIATLIKSKGSTPEIFLRSAGVPDPFLASVPAVDVQPFKFYSCFISYSHADKAFARRLHDALLGRGIRCWLDQHQLLPGDDLLGAVDEAIRIWDKVLLCCSKNSLGSSWVNKEWRTALKKEEALAKERGEAVQAIIPLNLDGYLFDANWKDWRKQHLIDRVAADFTDWDKDNVKFEQQLELVIKALRADGGGRQPPPAPKL